LSDAILLASPFSMRSFPLVSLITLLHATGSRNLLSTFLPLNFDCNTDLLVTVARQSAPVFLLLQRGVARGDQGRFGA
jgi:hypothetical protein